MTVTEQLQQAAGALAAMREELELYRTERTDEFAALVKTMPTSMLISYLGAGSEALNNTMGGGKTVEILGLPMLPAPLLAVFAITDEIDRRIPIPDARRVAMANEFVDQVDHLRTLTDDNLRDAESRIDKLCTIAKGLALLVRGTL